MSCRQIGKKFWILDFDFFVGRNQKRGQIEKMIPPQDCTILSFIILCDFVTHKYYVTSDDVICYYVTIMSHRF